MSLKELSEAIKEENLCYGVKQVLRAAKDKQIKKSSKVFIAKDTREETIEKLENADVEFEVLKSKAELSKALGLDFESEVFFIK